MTTRVAIKVDPPCKEDWGIIRIKWRCLMSVEVARDDECVLFSTHELR